MSLDTIVVGSGVGGLTAAVALARAGQRVLVLEQHYVPGGWAHSFTLDGYSFSPGVHYLGELDTGRPLRTMLEGLGLEGLSFWELNPDGLDHLLIGDERLDVPRGRDRWTEALRARFPHARKNIDAYFDILAETADELRRVDESLSFPRILALPLRAPRLLRFGLRTLAAVLDHVGIGDHRLRAVLTARCGNHGLAPDEVSFPVHAAMTAHYFDGAYYPRGGARRIVSAFVKALRRAGGEIRLRTTVRQILVERGRAVGVELEGGERIHARQVVSNADAATTYTHLLPMGAAPRLQRRAARMSPSVSCLSLFAAVDADLAALGYDSGNYWWYRHDDVPGLYARMTRALPLTSVDSLFLSVSTLKDPGHRPHGHHTLEMFHFVPYGPFERWNGSDSGARSPDYAAFKARLVDNLLEAASRVIPGIRERLVFCELGTPVTNVHYCAARNGGCYGTAKTPWQVGPFSLSTSSPVECLYLCGASTLSHGVAGASLSGLMVAKRILGLAHIDDCLGGAGTVRVARIPRHGRAPQRASELHAREKAARTEARPSA